MENNEIAANGMISENTENTENTENKCAEKTKPELLLPVRAEVNAIGA